MKKTFWEQVQEYEDREQEQFLIEYQRKKEERARRRKQKLTGLMQRWASIFVK